MTFAPQKSGRTLAVALKPDPDCKSIGGYSEAQINMIFSEETRKRFLAWMEYQTVSICDGTEYNHETKQLQPSLCKDESHGTVYYTCDVDRFLRHRSAID